MAVKPNTNTTTNEQVPRRDAVEDKNMGPRVGGWVRQLINVAAPVVAAAEGKVWVDEENHKEVTLLMLEEEGILPVAKKYIEECRGDLAWPIELHRGKVVVLVIVNKHTHSAGPVLNVEMILSTLK